VTGRAPIEAVLWDFGGIVDSSAVGVRKPNPAIYHLALQRLGVNRPDAAIFLDDFAPNVEAAIAIGLQGVVVDEGPASALAAIDRIIGIRRRGTTRRRSMTARGPGRIASR
jgi:putative hydrolase of the HAD superfamily